MRLDAAIPCSQVSMSSFHIVELRATYFVSGETPVVETSRLPTKLRPTRSVRMFSLVTRDLEM
jgi:hypothetical protein